MGDEHHVGWSERRLGGLEHPLVGRQVVEVDHCRFNLGGATRPGVGGDGGQPIRVARHEEERPALLGIEARKVLGDGGGRAQDDDALHARATRRQNDEEKPGSTKRSKSGRRGYEAANVRGLIVASLAG